MAGERAHWGSRLGFILAAAGSAVGLGNIWKFPYITGENGGGVFVLIYLACIAFVGLPILAAEVLVGRMAQKAPVGAMRVLSGNGKSKWGGLGWLGATTAFIILSYYSVVAGWCLQYVIWSLSGTFSSLGPEAVTALFDELYENTPVVTALHVLFMGLTMAVALGGIRGGVERAAKLMMPLLFLMFLVLLGYAATLDGFGKAFSFVFSLDAEKLTAAGVLEALGHSFFSLSLGMGAMVTYGSYLGPKDDMAQSTVAIGFLDTIVALCACLVLFPITFTFGMEPSAGPGLVFKNIPVAFSQLPAGGLWAAIFFGLLFFAAFTSAISLFEVVVSTFVDELRWNRRKAVIIAGIAMIIVGLPSALSGSGGFFGKGLADSTGRNWFDWFDYLATNWMLPLGGLGIAVFAAWRLGDDARRVAFSAGSNLGKLEWFYAGWLVLLRYLVPVAIVAVFLHAIGAI